MEIPPLVEASEEEEEGEKEEGTVEAMEGVGEKQNEGASHMAPPKLKWL